MLRRTNIICCVGLLLALGITFAAQESPNATVYIYRPGKFYGKVRQPSVYVDGKKVADIKNDRYFALSLTPGSHIIQSDERDDKTNTRVEQTFAAGMTYFFKINIEKSSFIKNAYGSVGQVDEDTARKEMAKLDPLGKGNVEATARDMVVLDRLK